MGTDSAEANPAVCQLQPAALPGPAPALRTESPAAIDL